MSLFMPLMDSLMTVPNQPNIEEYRLPPTALGPHLFGALVDEIDGAVCGHRKRDGADYGPGARVRYVVAGCFHGF